MIRRLLLLLSILAVLAACGGPVQSSGKAISAYSILGHAATIDQTDKTISLSLPSGTDLTALVATFTTSGSMVEVGGAIQASGVTANDFTSPVSYKVTAEDGTSAAYTVTVSTASGAWYYPKDLSDHISLNTRDCANPETAMDDGGNVIVVWQQYDASGVSQIFMSEYRNGSWTHPSYLTDSISPHSYDAENPHAAMDDNGNAVIVWQQSDGNYTRIYKSEYRGGVWTHPILSAGISPNGEDAFNPRVAMDNNGNALVVWQQSNGSYNQIYKSEYRSGKWTHPSGLGDSICYRYYDAYAPRPAMDDNGNALIVWQQETSTDSHIFKSEYRSSSWTHPASIIDHVSPNGQDADEAQTAMDNNGNAIIVWRQSNGAQPAIFKSEYRAGSWTKPADLNDYISPFKSAAEKPQAAMADNGSAMIVWQQYDDETTPKYQIFKSHYRSATGWAHPTLLSANMSPDGQHAYDPQIAMDNNGNAVISWYQSNGSYNQVYKGEYRNGVWNYPATLAGSIKPDGTNGGNARISMNDAGKAVVVWEQYDSESTPYFQIFKCEYR